MKVKICLSIFCLFFIINSISFAQVFGMTGDANRDSEITIIDALLVAQYYVGLEPSPFYEIDADADCNNVINIIDALKIAQYYVTLIDELTDCYLIDSGTLRFVNVEGGCWQIVSHDMSRSYEPIFSEGLVPLVDGLSFSFRYKIEENMGSICQVGIIIRIVEIGIGY